jgi:hypothetical protein
MNAWESVALKILVEVLERLVTPESVKKAEGWLVAGLAALAKSTVSKADDALVKILADALEVPVPTV